LVLEAAKRADFVHVPLTWSLELNLWIDPGRVTAEIGEHGYIYHVTADDFKGLYIRPESTEKSNQTLIIPGQPSIYQPVVARNTPQLSSDRLMRPIGIGLRSNLKRLNALLSLASF
jgi:hypothetical protein